MDKYYISYIIICVSIIILYGKYRCLCNNSKDPMEYRTDIDAWSISHFLAFALLGYLYPHSFKKSFSIGCLWELLEFYNEKTKPKYLKNIGGCPNLTTDREDQLWWYAKFSDIIMNLLGFIFGASVRFGILSIMLM